MSLKVLRTLGFSELTKTYTLYLANISVNSVKKKSQPKIGCPLEIKKPNPYGSKIAFKY